MPNDDTGIALGRRALFGVAGISGGSNPLNGSFHASEALVGVSWPVAGLYYSFDTVWESHRAELDEWATREGRIINLCWLWEKYITTVPLANIPLGNYDAHIDQMLAGMAAWPYEIACRLAPEMNGNWHAWSLATTSGPKFPYKGITSIQQFIDAWRYIVDKGRVQAPNVKWWFCPGGTDVGGYTAEDYYPGDDWVDLIGIDEYNTYGSWHTFYQVMAPMYDRLVALRPDLDFWIGETGCKEDPAVPGRKAEYVADMFAETRFAKLKVVTYFDTIGGFDWKFQTSQSALDAFTEGFADIINADAISDRWGVWPPAPPAAEVFVPDPLPMLALPSSGPDDWTLLWTDDHWHRQQHGNAATYINQIMVDGGSGTVAQRPKTAGNTPAIEAQATATGVASIAIIRAITTVAEVTKKAFATRSGGATTDHFGLRMDGRQDWGTGIGSTPTDTHLYRNAAGQLATGAVWFDQTTPIPSANPATGAIVYAEDGALKCRVNGLGAFTISRRMWPEAYSSTVVFNDNPKLASATAQPSAGFIHLATMYSNVTRTITNVLVEVTVAGSGLVDCYAAVYQTDGTRLGVTNDVATTLQSTGVRSLALATPAASVPPQRLVVALLLNGTTMPTIRTFAAAGNWNLSGISQLFTRASGSGLTAMPSPLNVASLSGATPTPFLVAIS